MSLSTSMKQ